MTPRRARAFMLIEVLVALGILAVGITGLMVALTSSLDRAKRAKDYSTAMFLAQHVMMEEEHAYAFSEEVATTNRGRFYDEGLPQFEWESETELDKDLGEYKITVRIKWTHKKTPLMFTLTQLVPAHRETLDELRKRK